MVKNVFSNLSRGFFYTIGRIIAFIFIGLVIGTLVSKINPKILDNLLLQVHAETVNSDIVGTANFYMQKGTIPNAMPSSYDSSISVEGGVYVFPSFTDQVIMPGYYGQSNEWAALKRVALNIDRFQFQANQTYTITLDFYFNYYDNYLSAMDSIVRSRNIWNTSEDNNIDCNYPVGSCSIRYNNMNSFWRANITYMPYSNSTGATLHIGSLNSVGKIMFYNTYRDRNVVVNIRSAKISYVNNGTNQDVANSITNNSNNIINNNNNNTNQIINNQNENTNKINDTLTSEEAPSSSDINDFFDDINDEMSSNTPISSLLYLPITLLNTYINHEDDDCHDITLGSLYGTTLRFPCIDIKSIIGNDLYSAIDTFICIYLFYELAMFCISIFETLTSLKDSFDSLYVPKHTYQPKHGGDS